MRPGTSGAGGPTVTCGEDQLENPITVMVIGFFFYPQVIHSSKSYPQLIHIHRLSTAGSYPQLIHIHRLSTCEQAVDNFELRSLQFFPCRTGQAASPSTPTMFEHVIIITWFYHSVNR